MQEYTLVLELTVLWLYIKRIILIEFSMKKTEMRIFIMKMRQNYKLMRDCLIVNYSTQSIGSDGQLCCIIHRISILAH